MQSAIMTSTRPKKRTHHIIPCRTGHQIAQVRDLFVEYNDFLGVDLSFQKFDRELETLPGAYGPPCGELLLAEDGTGAAGCVGLRRLQEEVCEMKRLFVRPVFRGTGLGRKLAIRIIEAAAQMGYRKMRLDTLDRLTAAVGLYETLGFTPIPPYYPNPLPGVTYWELPLTRRRGTMGMAPFLALFF
jgi:GNAT superfamily N-acetyltransferase